MSKIWQGTPPEKCDLNGCDLNGVFVDGKTTFGPWAIMCIKCHWDNGLGFGTGLGQKYQFQNDAWVKVAG